MKIVSPKEMVRAESVAYKNGASEDAFMEAAGFGISEFIEGDTILLLVGKGNNGGDALVAGRHLLERGSRVYALEPLPCKCKNKKTAFLKVGGKIISNILDLEGFDIIVDGFFGTGFRGSLEAPFAPIIEKVNQAEATRIAIDIPSGLNGETGQVESVAFNADLTLFLGHPKLGFFFRQGWDTVGIIECIPFGLSEELASTYELVTAEMASKLLPPIKRTRHKYEAGSVAAYAGSPEFSGAAILATTASLRSGAGIVRLLHTEELIPYLTVAPEELIKTVMTQKSLELIAKAKSVLIGPGIGLSELTRKHLKEVFSLKIQNCVIDADALTIISEGDLAIPKGAILTPHRRELARLLHLKTTPQVNEELFLLCHAFVKKHEVTLVVKGAPTWIFHPNCPTYVVTAGCPGMATAGSGDVLAGILAAFLAQGLSPLDTAIFGTYLHGLAGEIAEEELTPYGMMASDITNCLPEALAILIS